MVKKPSVHRASASTITFDNDEPFRSDVVGSPSETVNHDHIRRVLEARDIQQARAIGGEG